MKKFLLTSVVTLFCSQHVQACLMEFDLENIGTLKRGMQQISRTNSLLPELRAVISKTEKGLENLSAENIRCTALHKAANATRRPGTYMDTAELNKAIFQEDKLTVINNFHTRNTF